MISYITVTYNNLEGLKKTHQSLEKYICNQIIEWVVVDGASNDGTKEFLSNLPKRKNIKWTSEKDQGIYDAMNKSISLATQKFCCFLNAGDTLPRNLDFNVFLSFLEKQTTPTLVYGKTLCQSDSFQYESGHELSEKDLTLNMPICHQSIYYPVDELKNLNYDLDFKIIADFILTKALIINPNIKSVFYDQILSIYDLEGMSSHSHYKEIKEKWLYMKKYNQVNLQTLIVLSKRSLKLLVINLLRKLNLYKLINSIRYNKR